MFNMQPPSFVIAVAKLQLFFQKPQNKFVRCAVGLSKKDGYHTADTANAAEISEFTQRAALAFKTNFRRPVVQQYANLKV